MTPEQFAYWLQGYTEISGDRPSETQWLIIKDHLQEVFKKVTPNRVLHAADKLFTGPTPACGTPPPGRIVSGGEMIRNSPKYCNGVGARPESMPTGYPMIDTDAFNASRVLFPDLAKEPLWSGRHALSLFGPPIVGRALDQPITC